ncbi:hypothetical protein FE257_008166 [Aspergillus nanangensis]|uniref:Zn(2)-C6 fungal-type domain-containing protein n=1 Tax=Aspergillus nanangensis TaxID=2582783 RepID=A0AAD4CM37_ASPNN|nr:hypothetical protein FE257_008166 [Aspergillus nanangensis]
MTETIPSYGSDPEPSSATRRKNGRGSHQRRNTIRACDTCKEKKTRCSGTLPCLRCCRLVIQCEYRSSYSRGLVAPPPPPLDASDDIPMANRVLQSSPSTPSDFPQACSSRLGALACSGVHRTEHGSASGLSFLSGVCQQFREDPVASGHLDISGLAALNPEVPDASSVFQYGDKPYSRYYVPDVELPSFERAMHLVAIYFDFAVVTYRFLLRGRVEQWVSQLFESGISPAKPPSGPLVATACVVFSVFAIGALYEQRDVANQIDRDEQSERWLAIAKHLLALEVGPPGLETIQARLNVCLYLVASSRASESWFSYGVTVQLVIALGLHRASLVSADQDRGSAYTDQQLRKRIFWSVYTLDRYISVIFGRPPLLHEEDVDQEFPDELSDEDLLIDDPALRGGRPDHGMVTAVLHFRLAQILGSISRQLYTAKPHCPGTPVERAVLLMLELERWRENVPASHDQWRFSQILQLAYFHAIIHATRSLLFLNMDDMARSPVPTATVVSYIEKCMGAAEDIMTIVDDLSSERRLIQGFWFTHYICFCAITVAYIYIIRHHQSSPLIRLSTQHQDDAGRLRYLFSLAETCQQHLGCVTSHSSPSRRYGLILEELRLEVHRQIVSHLRPAQRRSTPDDPRDSALQSLSNGSSTTGQGSISQLAASHSSPRPVWTDESLPLDSVTWQASTADDAVASLTDDSNSLDGMNDPAWWAQVDSWTYSALCQEPFVFTF